MVFKKRKLKLPGRKLQERKDLKWNTMKIKAKNKDLTSWDDHLDKKYGKKGTLSREKYDEEFESFKIGVLIQEARKRKSMTQEELAMKAGTTKNYISRIENNASDIRLTTLMRIIREGLGGNLKFSIDFK